MNALVQDIINDHHPKYKVLSRSSNLKMLKWNEPYEIQALNIGVGHRYQRIGALGDGNCLLHSFLYATSPIYRTHGNEMRANIAVGFRARLAAHADELNQLARDYYGEERGGELIIIESMDDLTTTTHNELGIEFVPILGKMYEYNILAVQRNAAGRIRPVRNTFLQFDPSLPTVVINYVGAGLDFGHADYAPDGHYEPIVFSHADITGATSSEHSSDRKEKSKSKAKSSRKTKKAPRPAKPAKLIELPAETMFEFAPGAPELEPVLDLFRTPSEDDKYQAAAAIEAAARAARPAPIVVLDPISVKKPVTAPAAAPAPAAMAKNVKAKAPNSTSAVPGMRERKSANSSSSNSSNVVIVSPKANSPIEFP